MAKGKVANDQLDSWMVYKYQNIVLQKKTLCTCQKLNRNERPILKTHA